MLDIVPEVPVETNACRAGVRRECLGRGHGLVEIRTEDLLDDRVLGGEVMEERGLPDADGLRDLAGGRRVIAAPGEEPRRLDEMRSRPRAGAERRALTTPGRLSALPPIPRPFPAPRR